MRRSFLGRVVPSLLMTAAAAVPIVTSAEILLNAHASAQPAAGTGGSSASGGSGASTTPGSTDANSTNARTFSASADFQYGTISVTASVGSGRIKDVQFGDQPNDPRSSDIDSQALPMLRQETLQAQNAAIDDISGATYTSEAYKQALQSALDAAKAAGA